MGWSRPRGHVPSPQAGPAPGAAGPAGLKSRPARTGLRAQERKKKTWIRIEPPMRPAAPDRGRGRGAAVRWRR